MAKHTSNEDPGYPPKGARWLTLAEMLDESRDLRNSPCTCDGGGADCGICLLERELNRGWMYSR